MHDHVVLTPALTLGVIVQVQLSTSTGFKSYLGRVLNSRPSQGMRLDTLSTWKPESTINVGLHNSQDMHDVSVVNTWNRGCELFYDRNTRRPQEMTSALALIG